MIEKKEFVEYIEFCDNYYGTSRAELDRIRNLGSVRYINNRFVFLRYILTQQEHYINRDIRLTLSVYYLQRLKL